MKLAIYNSADSWGGNEKWIAMLAQGLAARGHETVACCLDRGPLAARLREMGIAVEPVHRRPGLRRAARLFLALRGTRPSVVLITSWSGTSINALAARLSGTPRVIVRLGLARTPSRRLDALAFRLGVDALIVNAPEIQAQWRAETSTYPPERIHLVLNGVHRDNTHRLAAQTRLRRQLGLDSHAWVIGAVGNVAHRKGFDLPIDGFAAAGLPDAHLAIVGDGPGLDQLRGQAARSGMSGRVHWLGRHADPSAFIRGCGVFVLSSRNEGMANVMLEAMAAGTPVIATDVSGTRIAVGPGPDGKSAGWIVPAENPAAITAALREVATLLQDFPEEVARRTEEALRRIDQRFGVERMIAQCEAVLLGERRSD